MTTIVRGGQPTEPGPEFLGRVDGFNQHESACKTDERSVAGVGLLAAHGDAFVSLELADRLFDARPEFLQPLGEETTSLLGVLTTQNHRCDATRKRGEAIRFAVITLISHCDASAIQRPVRRFWWRMFLSAVSMASKPAASAAVSRSPLASSDQPASEECTTSCPGSRSRMYSVRF